MTHGVGIVACNIGLRIGTPFMDSACDIQRFVVLGSARTGSNLLLSLLSAHPCIKTYGELFNLDMLPEENLLEVLEDPIAILQRKMYGAHRPEIAAVGFKMFYDHLTRDYFEKPINISDADPELQQRFAHFSSFIKSNYEWAALDERFRTTWEFLRANRSLGVIHLKRANM